MSCAASKGCCYQKQAQNCTHMVNKTCDKYSSVVGCICAVRHTCAVHLNVPAHLLDKGVHLIQPLLMQLLCSRHQVIIGLLNVALLLPAARSCLVALCIALPHRLTHHLMLTLLDGNSPVVLSLQHLCNDNAHVADCT